jgi:hypothetical protein
VGRRIVHERPQQIPFDELHYELRPDLVGRLTWAHGNAGRVAAMRFSHFGLKRLQADAGKRRIAYLVMRAGYSAVTLDDVVHVIAGNVPPPTMRTTASLIRRGAVLCEAARQFGQRGDTSNAETAATYVDFVDSGSGTWARFVGQPRERLLEAHRGSVQVPPAVRQLYAWIEEDEMIAQEPILRAAVLHWGLSILYRDSTRRMAVDAVIDHELRVGGLDSHGLLVLADSDPGARALRLDDLTVGRADAEGDLTSFLEHFSMEIARAFGELHRRLESFQDREDRLHWLVVRPPDELDRAIFDAVERMGAARSSQIIEALHEPPPLRTLQRRLQRLCKGGLLAKHGGRRDAFYQVAERA